MSAQGADAIEALLGVAAALNARLENAGELSTQELGLIAASLTRVYAEIRQTRQATSTASSTALDPRLAPVRLMKGAGP